MTYIGDFTYQQEVRHHFPTSDFSTGLNATIVGGAIAVYQMGNIAERTGGMTLTADFDGRTGYNEILVDTDNTFYDPSTTGHGYSCMFTAGTAAGVSIVGKIAFTFSIQNRSTSGNFSAVQVQQIRDAMKLDPSTGLPGPDSIDSKIDSRAAPTDVVTAGAINTASGAVSTVNLCNTTTTNTDMRGTDGAALPTDIISGGSPPLSNTFAGVQADMRAINGQSAPVNVMESLYDTIIEPFTVVSVVSAQQFVISITGKPNDYYRDAGIQFDAGANVGVQGRRITTYNGTTGQITLNEPFTTDPVPLDTGLLMGYIATA